MSGRLRRSWTPREDALLRQLVQKELENSRPILWQELAKNIPGRSNKDCRKRWWNSLIGSTAKGAWSPDEDRKLIDAVDKYGTNHWSRVAADVGTRSGDQCSSHWRQVLNPNINYCDWTKEEDDHLLKAVRICGTNWSAIASFHVPERTTLALKNRYWKLRMQNQSAATSGKTTPNHHIREDEEENEEDEYDDSEIDVQQSDMSMWRWPHNDWPSETPSLSEHPSKMLDPWTSPNINGNVLQTSGYTTPATIDLSPVEQSRDGLVDLGLSGNASTVLNNQQDTTTDFSHGVVDLDLSGMSDLTRGPSHNSYPSVSSQGAMWCEVAPKDVSEVHRISFTVSCTTDQLGCIMSVLAAKASDVQVKLETP